MPIAIDTFGRLRDGRAVRRATLSAPDGLVVEIIEYGARLRGITVPRPGREAVQALLGYATLAEYEKDDAYLGAAIGRCANRTAIIPTTPYPLTRNEGRHHLHGGTGGVSRAVWYMTDIDDGAAPRIRLDHRSADGEDGYPGAVDFALEIALDGAMGVRTTITATGDVATPVDLTLHPYFNLTGNPQGAIDDHELWLPAGNILELDDERIPTGRALPVADTPFDFRKPVAIGARIDADDPHLRLTGGYDHYWIADAMPVRAALSCPASGVSLELTSNQPGLQFYSGNHLRSPAGVRRGLCLEPHGFPNAINIPDFPDPVLQPGTVYRHETVFAFAAGRGGDTDPQPEGRVR